MGKLIHTTKETATEECFCLEYFDDGTDNKYIDENKYKVVATKEKEITLEEMINSELITEMIKEDDKNLAEDGWTYEEAKAFAERITNNKDK